MVKHKTTITLRSMTREKARLRMACLPDTRPKTRDDERPKTRADCADVPRPCPFVGCRYNLALEAASSGALRVFADVEAEDERDSCALDVAARGPMPYAEIGKHFGVAQETMTKEGHAAIAKLKRLAAMQDAPGHGPLPELECV